MTSMKPIPAVLAGLLLAVPLGSACSADGEPSAIEAAPTSEDQHGHGDSGTHGAHGELASVLVTSADLPAGYRQGAGHHDTSGARLAPPRTSADCAPIAEVIGTHPSVLQTEHPQATVSFSKGHFGPQVTETVIDVGDPVSAAAAVERVRTAGVECRRYVQSTSSIGANDYTVTPWDGLETEADGVTLRLHAVGADFKAGINWDVWVTAVDSQLVAVTFRSALGGGNADLTAAVAAAMGQL